MKIVLKIILLVLIAGSVFVFIPSAGAEDVKLVNPIGGTVAKPEGTTSIPQLVGTIVKSVLGIVGSIALGMFVYGGFLMLASAGNAAMVKKGQDAMVWAVIGLAIIFASYALVTFVLKTIGATS